MTNIEIKDQDGRCELKVEGHSGYSSAGTDIVCSAISILCFTLLNMTVLPVHVRIDLYCEGKNPIRNAANLEIGGSSLQICRLTSGENGALSSNRCLPEGVPFAVRFLCDTPIVVSNQKHAAVYHSSLCL